MVSRYGSSGSKLQSRGPGIRTIAIDWSGAAKRARKRIWLAEVRDDELVRLESDRTRSELTDHLIDLAREDSDLVVGVL